MEAVAARLAETVGRIGAAAHRSGRSPDAVQLVAVSKGHPAAAIVSAYEAGHRQFGESRAQELAAKVPELPADIEWHFIGPLQRNKVKSVRPHVVALHSLDRDSLATRWDGGPPAWLQVRLGGEVTKPGHEPSQVAGALGRAVDAGVTVIGLMTIPPPVENPNDARPWFVQLRRLRDAVIDDFPSVQHLSMGMSADFEVAVEDGATIVRVGSTIFGPRIQH